MDYQKVIQKKSEYWKKKLIDLSKRNNLISYRFTKSKSLKIEQPVFGEIIKDLDHEKNIQLLKKQSKKESAREWLFSDELEEVDKKLTNLFQKAKENFQELGLSTAFVSLGMLKYRESPSSKIDFKAPIFLFPVTISKVQSSSKKYHRYELDSSSSDVQVNPAIVEKLALEFDIKVPEFKDMTIHEFIKQFEKLIEGQSKWEILQEAYLDIFSYQKYIMYKDISEHSDLLKDSSLVQAFVGDRAALQDEIAESQREEFDDAKDIDILPADSSQKLAIELAKAGVTFVLQGPPGTGKSQTIANMIAALLEKKKKVLFVSQKMAALNVVQKRLDDVGLGRYCLNLHNYKGNKKEVVKQLMIELETSPKISDSAKVYSFNEYLSAQQELNEFYNTLCTKVKPHGLSLYDIRGEISKLHHVELVDKKLNEVLEYPSEKFNSIISKISELGEIAKLVENPTEHPLYALDKSKNTTIDRKKFKSSIVKLHSIIQEVQQFQNELQKKCSKDIDNIESLQKVVDMHVELISIDIPDHFFSNKFEEINKEIGRMYQCLKSLQETESSITSQVNQEFIHADIKYEERIIRETPFIKRLFNNEYKSAKKTLFSYSQSKISHSQWIKLFDQRNEAIKLEKRYSEYLKKNSKISKIFDDKNSLEELTNLFEKSNKFLVQFNIAKEYNPKNPSALLSCLVELDPVQEQLINALESLQNISGYFDSYDTSDLKTITSIDKFCEKSIQGLLHLADIIQFKSLFESLGDTIKGFIKEYFLSNNLFPLKEAFLKSYFVQLQDSILASNPLVTPKRKADYFKDFDFEVRDNKRFKIMDSIEKEQPEMNFSSHGNSEVSILKRENEKKRRLKPIRELLEKTSNLVFTLKPCFMMSPLSVSQYIDPKEIKFDVVIFDEASQIMPEDAIPCLIRAKQAIVVGDTEQLPPTSFFMSSRDDDSVEEELEDLESFLSECSIRFRSKSLNWHYRSKNEHLIAFSNRFFYEHRLITFPNAKSDDSGLDFQYVAKGVYDRGKSRKNRVEAKAIVKKYQTLKKQFPKKSFGIIAFSLAQERAIREEFSVAGLSVDDHIDSHGEELFIKNLETVQGDERDIILISVGYGKDSSGKLSYNFGPLNRDGGYKRLNVAVTRSRFQTIVFSSINPEDLDEDRINADGVRYLKYYLDYAKNKDFNKFLQTTEGLAFDSSFEEAVYEALVSEGYQVSSQVGCSGYRVDLAIKHPKKKGEYLLGIECDGAQYHSSKFARDRDKVRQKVLEGLGWNIHRIWSEDWINNREYELEQIKSKVDRLLKSKGKKKQKVEKKFSKVSSVHDFKEVSLKEKYPEYEVSELEEVYADSREFEYYTDEMTKRMIKVLKKEDPIDKVMLFKRVLDSVGVKKLGKRIERVMDHCLSEMERKGHAKLYGNTVSLKKNLILAEVKISTEDQRPFTLIPKEEIAGAIVDLLKNSFSATKETLIADIAKGIYHNNRTGKKIELKIQEGIDYLLNKKLIQEEKGKIKLSK